MFQVDLVTAEKMVFSGEVESLVAPGYDGYLGILAGHMPLLCLLKQGEIKIKKENVKIRYKIRGGFLEVWRKKAIVLADDVKELGN